MLTWEKGSETFIPRGKKIHENSLVSKLLGQDLSAEGTDIYNSSSHCKSGVSTILAFLQKQKTSA